ncbi:MAG: hypothetical protein GXP63_01810 [DPANN group archaeon]|nr:hypothetical protein [DPANN group archaeon]
MKPARKRINIPLDQKIHLQVKVIAAIKGLTLNDYLVKAIEKRLRRRS